MPEGRGITAMDGNLSIKIREEAVSIFFFLREGNALSPLISKAPYTVLLSSLFFFSADFCCLLLAALAELPVNNNV
jgi:hypothetical protein